MIAADVRIEGFDARAFTNLVSLFAPNVVFRSEREPAESDAPEIEASEHLEGSVARAAIEGHVVSEGMLVVVVSARGVVRKAFHSRRGRARDFVFPGWNALDELPRRYGARRVVVLREGVLDEVLARAASRMHREDDYVAQWLHVARAFREEIDRGNIAIRPRASVPVPLPTAALVRRALDSVLPDDRSFVLAVWRRGALWTAVVVRRRAGEIDWIAGPDCIARWTGPLGGDWRRDHRVVSRVVTEHVAPVHLGVYGELHSIRRLLRSRKPGAWARATLSREIIIQPTPPYVMVALGADAMRRVAQKSKNALGGLDPMAPVVPWLGALRGRIVEVASVTRTLGFDPLGLLAQFLERVDPEGLATEPRGEREPRRSVSEAERVDAPSSAAGAGESEP